MNNLPEDAKMVEISSNIWGTKFKIHSLDISLPPILGQVQYSTVQYSTIQYSTVQYSTVQYSSTDKKL